MVIDWLAAGVDPDTATLFIQSRVPEHAELHVLLSMITPLAWLERVPTYKDQQAKLKDKDLATYGFLGYPLLQSADILIYRAGLVPVGEDQVAHVELTREVARRFNHLYGREPGLRGSWPRRRSRKWARRTPSSTASCARLPGAGRPGGARHGARAAGAAEEHHARRQGAAVRVSRGRRARSSCPSREALLDRASKMPGLDGQKMSKSYQQYHRAARRPGRRGEEAARPCRPIRRACAAPIPAPGQVPGVGVSSGLFRRRRERLGARGLPLGRDRLPGMQATGGRCGAGGTETDPGARRRILPATRSW